MAIPYTFTNGTTAEAPEVNANFTAVENEFKEIGLVPIGSVIAWTKNLTNTPALDQRFVECNGQVLSDGDSVYDGVTIPNLNGNNNFLRGNSTSGGTGGTATHTHSVPRDGWGLGATTNGRIVTSTSQSNSCANANNTSGDAGTLPPYYNIVWIMRIK
jgi:hypothetical protein